MPVIEQLYAGIGDEDAFQDACRAFGRTLQAPWCVIHSYDHRAHSGTALARIEGVSKQDVEAYASYWAPRNVWMTHGRDLIRPGCITVGHLLCSDKVLERSEWYYDFLRPHGLYHTMGCVLRMTGQVMTSVTFLRARDVGHYLGREQRALRTLGPHLENAFRLHERIRLAEEHARLGQDLLESMPVAVALVGSMGHVEAMNRRAREILANRDGLELFGGCLVATVPASSIRLHRLIRAGLSTPESAPMTGETNLLILRPSGCLPYQAWVLSLGPRNTLFRGTVARAAVFISDPETDQARSLGALIQMYRLTPREAELGLLLATGKDLRQAATAMNVSVSTAHTHLEHLFAKTCTHRQTDLVRLVLAAPGATTMAPADVKPRRELTTS